MITKRQIRQTKGELFLVQHVFFMQMVGRLWRLWSCELVGGGGGGVREGCAGVVAGGGEGGGGGTGVEVNLKGESECYGNWIEFRFLFLMFNCPF